MDDVLVTGCGANGSFAEPGSLVPSGTSNLSTGDHRTNGVLQEADEREKNGEQIGASAAEVVLFAAIDAVLSSDSRSGCSTTSDEQRSSEHVNGKIDDDSRAVIDASSPASYADEHHPSVRSDVAVLAPALQRLWALSKLCRQLLLSDGGNRSCSSSANCQLPANDSNQQGLPGVFATCELSNGYTDADTNGASAESSSSATAPVAASATAAELLSVASAIEAQLEAYLGCYGDAIQTAASSPLNIASSESCDLLYLRQCSSQKDRRCPSVDEAHLTRPDVDGSSQSLYGSGSSSLLLQRMLKLEQSYAAVLTERDRLSAELTAARGASAELEDELDCAHEEYQAQVVQAQRTMAAEMQVNWEAAQRRAAEEKKADVEQIRLQMERRYQAAYIEELRKTQKKFNDDLDTLNRRYTEGSLHQLSTPSAHGGVQLSAAAEDKPRVTTDEDDVRGTDGLIRVLTLKQEELEHANRSLSKELEAAHRLNEVMSEELISLRSENETITLQLSRSSHARRSGSLPREGSLTLKLPVPCNPTRSVGSTGGGAAVTAAGDSDDGSAAEAAVVAKMVADGGGDVPPCYHAADCRGPLLCSGCPPGMGTFVAESPSLEDVNTVRSLLNSAHHELFDRMQQHWGKVHAEELAQLDADRRYEIHVQLESLRAVMQQTYNGQIELLRSSYADEADRRVADAVQRLTVEHQRELNDLEASWARRLEQTVAESAAARRFAAGAAAADAGQATAPPSSAAPDAPVQSATESAAVVTGRLSPPLTSDLHLEGSPMPGSDGISVIVSTTAAAGAAGAAAASLAEQPPTMAGDSPTSAATVGTTKNVGDVAGISSADDQQSQQQQRQQRSDSAASMVSTGSLTAGAGHWRQRSNGGSGYEDDFEDWGVEEAALADDILSPRRFLGEGSSPLCAAGDAASAALRDRDYFKRAATLTIISDLDSESEESSPRDGARPPMSDDDGKLKVVDRPPGVGDCCRRALAAAIAERQSHVERAERERDRVWQARVDALNRAHEAEVEAYKFRPDSTDELIQMQLQHEAAATGATSSASSADVSFEVRAIQASLRKNGLTLGRSSAAAAVLDEHGIERDQKSDLLRRAAEPQDAEEEARSLRARSEDRQAQAEVLVLRQSAAESEEKHCIELLAVREQHEREMEALKREHIDALRQAGQEWQDRMNDALHAASLDSERLAEELDSWKSKAMALAAAPVVSDVARSPSSAVLPDVDDVGNDEATGEASLKSGQSLKETIAGWRQSMTELMAEQEAIRRENAEGLDQLRGTYEDQLVSLQHAVQQLVGQIADKDDTILKLTVRLKAVDAAGEQTPGAAEHTSDHEVVLGAGGGAGQNGRRVVEPTELVRQLQDDVQRLQEERDAAVESSERLHRLLAAALQQQRSAGECITKHLGCGNGDEADGPRLMHASQQQQRLHNGVNGHSGIRDCSTPKEERMAPLGASAAAMTSHQSRVSTPRGRRQAVGSSDPHLDKSFDTVASDEGLDLSQHKMNDSLWALLDLDDDRDDIVADAGRSLQSSVDRLLEVLEQTRRQLAEARVSRDELLSELLSSSASSSHSPADADRARAETLQAAVTAAEQAAAALRTERDELAERLARETASHQRLVLELQNAEGMLNGYIADRSKHEEQLLAANDAHEQLENQCAALRLRLQMLEEQRADADAANRLAERQNEAVVAAVSNDEAAAALLRQNTQLDREKHEMSRQYERDRRRLLDRIRELEQKVEDVSRANDDLLDQSQTDKHDLELQLDALDRQLRASKQFIEEQTHEREAEREEYQRDAKKYQIVVEERKRLEAVVCKLQNQVAELEAQLQDMDGSGGGSPRSPRYRRGSMAGDCSDSPRTIQIDELKKVVRYLEVELETKSSQENELKERLVAMEAELVALTGLNGDLEAELKHRRLQEARSTSDSAALLEELQELATANAAQLASLRQERDALVAELDRQKAADEELTHENNALRKQVNELLLQESALKSKLDSLKPGGKAPGSVSSAADGGMALSSGRVLHERLIACEETLEKRTAQVAELEERLAYERERAAATIEELSAESRQAAVRVEHGEARHAAQVSELQSLLQEVRDDSRNVHAELEVFKGSTQSIPPYAQKIIAEKNEELDHLNAQIARLNELLTESTSAKLEKEAADLRILLQKKDDALQEKEEELFTVTEELTALQHQLEAIQGGNSFAQEEAAAQQLQLEETVTDLQQQLAAAALELEEARSAGERAASGERLAVQLRMDEMSEQHAADLLAARKAEAERWQDEVAATRQANESIVAQLRALLDEKESISRRAEMALIEAEAAKQAMSVSRQNDIASSMAELQKQLEEKDRLLEQKESLVQAENKERLRLVSARSAMEEELSWHRMELQEKDKLMSLLQLQVEQRSQQCAELQAKLDASARELEKERSALAAETLSQGERLAAANRELQEEREHTRVSLERAAEADRRLSTLESELRETRLQLSAAVVASAAAATDSAPRAGMQASEAAASKGTTEKSSLSEQELWQARLEQERSDHEARVRELQANHRATLAATVDEVKQNLKKAYRRHLATVLKSKQLPDQGHSPTDRRQSPAGAEPGSESAVQQLLSQALVQGSEILALSLSPPSATSRRKAPLSGSHGHSTASGREQNVDSVRNGAAADEELDQLEERVQSLAARQAAAVDVLLAADRRSLLGEIRELRAHLELSRAQHDATASRLGDELDEAVRRATGRERQLQLQLQVAEQRSGQERVALHDARSDLEAERQSSTQLRELLAAERSRSTGLAGDIRALETEVERLEQTVEWRDKQVASLRQSMEEERREHGEQLVELRRREQRALDELQRLSGPHQRLVAEHSRTVQDLEAAVETLKREVATEKDRCDLATQQAETERQRATEYRIRLEDAAAELRRTEVKYGSLATDFQQQLEDERAVCRSLASRLDEERQRCTQLQNELAAAAALSDERTATADEVSSLRQQAEQLRVLLEQERRRCNELQSAFEREIGRSSLAAAAAEADRRRLVGELQEEQGASSQLKKTLDTSEAQCHESTKRALRDGETIKQLSNELDRMRSRINLLQSELEITKQQRQEHCRSDIKARQDPSGERAKIDRELDGSLPSPSASPRLGRNSAAESATADSSAANRRATTLRGPSSDSKRGDSGVTSASVDAAAAFRQQLDALRARLRRATLRLQGGTVAEEGDASTAATDLRQIADELQRLHGDAAASIERRGGRYTPASLLSAASLDEVLRHNAELARFVAKLSEEKADLREALANLEEEIWLYRQHSKAEGEGSYRTAGEQRRTAAGTTASSTTPLIGDQRLRERLHRAQAAWLRAESLRKALVFQKRYLLLLLGGFEECEAATLQAVSRMAANPRGSVTSSPGSRTRCRGVNRFRSAAYAVAAIRRMKILVNKWHKSAKDLAIDAGSPRPQHTAVIGNDFRQPLSRHPSPVGQHRPRSSGRRTDADDKRRSLVNGSSSPAAVGASPHWESARCSHSVSRKRADVLRHRHAGRFQLVAGDDGRLSDSDSSSSDRHSGAGFVDDSNRASPRNRKAADKGSRDGCHSFRRDGDTGGDSSSRASDGITCFRPAMLSASRLLQPLASGHSRPPPDDATSPVPSQTSAHAPSRPPSAGSQVRGGDSSSGGIRRPPASSFFPQQQHAIMQLQDERGTSTPGGSPNDRSDRTGRRSPPHWTLQPRSTSSERRESVKPMMPTIVDGRSPASSTLTRDYDGDSQSVDSQYIRRLESVQLQLARDLLL